jgi:hypothetical protein
MSTVKTPDELIHVMEFPREYNRGFITMEVGREDEMAPEGQILLEFTHLRKVGDELVYLFGASMSTTSASQLIVALREAIAKRERSASGQ